MKVPHINTFDGITVVLFGRPFSVSSSDKVYDQLVSMVEGEFSEQSIYDLLQQTANKLKKTLELAPDMEYSGGVVTYRGEVLHNYAVERLIGLIEAGRDHTPLAKFLAKLQDNPSKRVVDNLYSFLEKGSIPIAEDGDFLAYKAVRADYKDIHSGTFDNSLGSVCEMPRNRVDEDPNRTCSAGLHVCSFQYLPHFSHADGHVVICKISPADVVAIPADYNDTKMRVSRYEVIGEVEDYYRNHTDVLGEVGRSSGVMEPGYTVFDEDGRTDSSYYSLEEAKKQARHYFDRYVAGAGPDAAVTVRDEDGMVLWTIEEDEDGEVSEF